MPAGGFRKAFGEHELIYKQNKEKAEADIRKNRDDERTMLKNHYGSLKHKPKKGAVLLAQGGHVSALDPSLVPRSLANSVDVTAPDGSRSSPG